MLNRRKGINHKAGAKWRKRATVEDMEPVPSEPRPTDLTAAEEVKIVAFLPEAGRKIPAEKLRSQSSEI